MTKFSIRDMKAYLYLSPLFLGLIVFSYYPPIDAFYKSFFIVKSTAEPIFVGLDNYLTLFHDKIFVQSIPRMFLILIPSVLICIIIPFIVAEMIYFVKNSKAKYWYRLLILLPMIVPGVVGVLIWKFIYDPEIGLLNAIFAWVGLEHIQPNWLGDPSLIIFSLVFLGFPWIAGQNVLIYLAGLLNISTNIIEAAEMEGATGLKRIWYIDIPSVMGQIKFFLVFGIIFGLQDYSRQLILTDGGPGYSSMVPGYYLYKSAFRDANYGYANAIGVIMFVFILLITLFAMKSFKTNQDT